MRIILSVLLILNSFVLSSDYNELYNKILEKFSHAFSVGEDNIELQVYNSEYKNEIFRNKEYIVQLNNRYNKLGFNTVWLLYIDSKGIIIRKTPLTVKVSASFDVLTAKKDIPPGVVINSKYIDIRKLKIERGNLDFFRLKDLPELSGMVAKRFIRKGEIIREHMVKEKPTVKRGSEVKVKLVSKSFDLTTNGILKEDGYMNEEVRVACEPTGKILTGVLKDTSLVIVELR